MARSSSTRPFRFQMKVWLVGLFGTTLSSIGVGSNVILTYLFIFQKRFTFLVFDKAAQEASRASTYRVASIALCE